MYAGENFDEDDALGRKKYADFIVDMIRHGADYLQEDDAGSFSIAIDSAYGTGKTVFLRKLEKQLEEKRYARDVIDVIHYNAWEADYTGDAFGAMKDAVLDESLFRFEKGREGLKRALKGLIEVAEDVAGLWHPAAGPGAKAAKSVAMPEKTEGQRLKKAMKAWQKAFSQAMQENGTLKMVVMVDELDRCRPDFAIATLEIAKHLMNVENVVFVYALDMQQMGAAVRAAYGDAIDASGYLCKLFHYVTKLPLPSVEGYMRLWVEKGIQDGALKNAFLYHDGFMSFFITLARDMHVTLRQIDVIMRTYIILYEQFLHEYKSEAALKLYLYFVFLKYAKAEVFDALFLGRGKVERKELAYIAEIDEAIDKICSDGKKYIGDIVSQKKYDVRFDEDRRSVYVYPMDDSQLCGREILYLYDGNEQEYLFGCLFFPDMIRYNTIRGLTLAGYIHQNMEMFFFALPEEKQLEKQDA